MWEIEKIKKRYDGYMIAYIPDHPKAHGGYVLLHRAVMENHLGRLLSNNEIVHHIDENKQNNTISNLRLMTTREHAQLHRQMDERKMVCLKCPQCGTEFIVPKNKSYLQKPRQKYKCTCCSTKCRGKFYKTIQMHGITQDIQNKIDSCFIKEFEQTKTKLN